MPSTYWSYDAGDIRHLPQGVSLWRYRQGSPLPILKVLQSVRTQSEATASFPFHPMPSRFRPGSGPRGPMILAALFCREAGSKEHRAKRRVSETTHMLTSAGENPIPSCGIAGCLWLLKPKHHML